MLTVYQKPSANVKLGDDGDNGFVESVPTGFLPDNEYETDALDDAAVAVAHAVHYTTSLIMAGTDDKDWDKMTHL